MSNVISIIFNDLDLAITSLAKDKDFRNELKLSLAYYLEIHKIDIWNIIKLLLYIQRFYQKYTYDSTVYNGLWMCTVLDFLTHWPADVSCFFLSVQNIRSNSHRIAAIVGNHAV